MWSIYFKFYNLAATLFLLGIGLINIPDSLAQKADEPPLNSEVLPFFQQDDEFDIISERFDLDFYPWNLLELTPDNVEKTLRDIRLFTEKMKNSNARSIIFDGFVQGYLLREDVPAALRDAYRIQDMNRLANALVRISEFLLLQDEPEEMQPLLEDAIGIMVEQIALFDQRFEEAKIQAEEAEDDEFDFTPFDIERQNNSQILRRMGSLLLATNRIERAIEVMQLIPDDLIRVSALREAANAAHQLKILAIDEKKQALETFEATEARALEAIEASLRFSKSLAYNNREIGKVTLELIRALIDMEQIERALEELDALKERLESSEEDGRYDNLVEIAAGYIMTDDPRAAMGIIRELSLPSERARALGVIGRARNEIGDSDAAMPLFLMAIEEVERVRDGDKRNEAYASLAQDLTRAGRLADAFEMAGKINGQPQQGIAIARMSNILLQRNLLEEARVLTDYIPQTEYRMPILVYLSRLRGVAGDREGASQSLLDAMAQDLNLANTDLIPELADLILEHHTLYGSETMDEPIIEAVSGLINQLPNGLIKIDGLIRLAIAQSKMERLDQARQTANGAFRIAFDFDQDQQFPDALEVISYGQVLAGDLLGAFDSASRTPQPLSFEQIESLRRLAGRRGTQGNFELEPYDPNQPLNFPRFRALARISGIAAQLGEADISIRAASVVNEEMPQAAILTAATIGVMSEKISIDLVLNDIANALDIANIPVLSPTFPDIFNDSTP